MEDENNLDAFKKSLVYQLRLMVTRIKGLLKESKDIDRKELLEECSKEVRIIKKIIKEIDDDKLEYRNNFCITVRLETKVLNSINFCFENLRYTVTNDKLTIAYSKLVAFHLYLLDFIEKSSKNNKA
ncbi:hypothetical protein DLH72_02885 [Candidatus Gracilibacteria bacterium]|nr:MAG: hypothetical protein DLH72_02885 [Candidatus Gracilibacteria bacterium]